jgi:phosphonopyruvate decarboxylase
MIDQKVFYDSLRSEGVDFFAGVPDSLLNEFCLYVQNNAPANQHIIAANEGNAIGLAAGHHLATGQVSLVYMQNAGMGNALNPLVSLTHKEVYSIPLVLLIGWRGDPSVSDWVQHKKQGELTPVLLDSMDIPYKIVDDDSDNGVEAVRWAVNLAKEVSSPVALVAKKGMFERGKGEANIPLTDSLLMTREDAIRCVVESVPEESIFVATTGRTTRELYFLREAQGSTHDNDFLNVGAMGHASSIAMGIALSAPDRLVVCLDGDAAALMHLGAFAIAGTSKAHNLLHVVLNNGAHESVGGQPSVGQTIKLAAIAENAGYGCPQKPVRDEGSLREAIADVLTYGNKPKFIDAHIRTGLKGTLPPLKISHRELKESFARNVQRYECT